VVQALLRLALSKLYKASIAALRIQRDPAWMDPAARKLIADRQTHWAGAPYLAIDLH
jgi:hypothetical protein